LVCVLYVTSEHIYVSPNHIKRFMAEYALERKNIRPVLYGHLRKGMTESVRRAPHVFDVCLTTILSNTPTHTIPIHFLIIYRNKQPIDRRRTSCVEITL